MLITETNEETRVEALRQFGIIDARPEPAFDELVRAAATLCKTPAALIERVEKDRVWVQAKIGVESTEFPREHAFSAQAIQEDDVLIIPDTLADERFAAWVPVIADRQVRFYAGMPLVTRSGHAIGTLSVLDFAPRELSRQQTEWLRILGKQVVSQLERHLNAAGLAQIHKELDEHTSVLKTTEAALRQRVEDLHQLRTSQDELEAARTAQLTGVLGKLQQELAERTQLEETLIQRDDELRQLRTRLEEMTAERTIELARLNEQLQQESAARLHAEQIVSEREAEWSGRQTHLEGLIAEQTAELARVKEELQRKLDELGHLNEAMLHRDEQLRKVQQVLGEMAEGVRQELERCMRG